MTSLPHNLLTIDGSAGEGGGQILRSSLALSLALGVPFRITNIRANREKPGLMRQHLTAVEAAAAISSAQCEGAAAGSRELLFVPGPLRPGNYRFAIGTAGSTTMVLQAILPPLLFADAPSELTIEGGTHTRWAPPFEFLERSLLPALRGLGASVTARLDRYGFYPAGGGAIHVRIEPTAAPRPVLLHERGAILDRSAEVVLSRLPFDVALRELEAVRERLGWETDPRNVTTVSRSASPGNTITLGITSEGISEAFCAIGEHRKPASAVAGEAIDQVRAYLAAGVPVGSYLADQLMVPMAIAAARGAGRCGFTTLPLSRHASTNSEIVERFEERCGGPTPRVERLDAQRARWEIGG